MFVPFTDQISTSEVIPVDDRPHQIGELAASFGVTLRTLRFYEERGLVKPRRVSARTRLYDVADVARLSLIVTCRRFGISLDTITDLLGVRDTDGVEAFQPRLVATLTARAAEMATEIDDAEALRRDLIAWLTDMRRAA